LARNDDGEFELILGNRQLISVFLIIVILLGVFFSIGYIVGRNSGTAVVASDTSRTNAANKPIVVDSPRPSDSSVPEPKPAETKPVESRKPSPLAPEKPKPVEPAPTASSGPGSDEPHAGQTFLQVVATGHADADLIAETLAKKGFHAIVAPSPTGGMYRVLVGPLKDAGTISETRTKLESAGFKEQILRKY
jgi:cell division septation protein DedD